MQTREKEICKVTVVGGIVNALLLVAKFLAGFFGHSAAMVADAVHSLSDFVTDVIVLVFVRISSKPQDKDHDYGHGKYETIAATLIGLALLAVAINIVYQGGMNIARWVQGEQLPAPGKIALYAALLSIVLKELVYQYTIRKAKTLNSSAMEANAWHHRSDAFSSVGTAVGIGGAILLGDRWTVLDPLASVVVGAIIIKVAVEMMKRGFDELTERSLPDDVEDEILEIVAKYPDVSEPHHLRTRRIGNKFAIELHIRMDGDISLREAHHRTMQIEHDFKTRFGEDTHVALHIEPIKDENGNY